jgi:hypothetical protein
VSKEVTQLPEDGLQEMAVDLTEDDQCFDYNTYKAGRYTKITTLKSTFQTDSEYNEVCSEFEKTSGLVNCRLDYLGNDDAVGRFSA